MNNTFKQHNMFDICTAHPSIMIEYTFFSKVHRTFAKIDYVANIEHHLP